MAGESAPAFQFYVRDWLGNANVRAMTPEARGVYMDLLCYCWQEGHISSDVPTLSRLSGLPLARFRRVWAEIAPRFQLNGNGYRHARLDKERQVQEAHRLRQSERGRKGALALQRKHASSTLEAQQTGQPEAGSSSASAVQEPPNPPLRGGRRLTAGELENARKHRAKVGCPHGLNHPHGECVRQIALSQRGEAVAS